MMKMPTARPFWILTLALSTALATAEVQVINVDIGSGRSPLYVGRGAAGTGGTVWNAVKTKLPALLIDSKGNSTPVSVISISPGYHWWQKEPEWPLTVAGAEDLMLDYWAFGRGQSFVIELGGIPLDWSFDLFVYSAGDTNNQGGLLTIGEVQQSTTGIMEPGKPLTKGVHYVVFTGLKAKAGSLLIEAAHNPAQPGEFGVINGFQLIVHEPEAVALPVPPPVAPAPFPAPVPADSSFSSGWWVSIGFGLAVIFVVVLRRVMRPDAAPVPAVVAQPILTEGRSSSTQAPMANTSAQDPRHGGAPDEWRERAEAAERRATAAETVVREGLMPEMKKVLKHKVVSHLVTEREELIEAQRRAAMDIAAIERRLTEIQAPVRDRLDAYEQRITDLEKELNQRGAENRELLKATIALARQKLEEERSRSRLNFN